MKNVLTFDIHGTEVLFYKGISRGKPAITIVVWLALGAVLGSFTLPFDTPEARDADFARIDEARARNLVYALQLA